MTKYEAIEVLEEAKMLDDSMFAYSQVYNEYRNHALDMAIEALKAQEPRVMTLEDFENNPNVDQYGCLPCWMEYREEPKWDGWAEATVHTCVEYGRRPWTSRPTKEMMEATPWDVQGQRDYEAAVEMAEYCERYEPTYNADDGSM